MDLPTRLLVLAGEDFTGLWDVASEGVDAELRGGSNQVGLVRDALRLLLDQGWVECYARRSNAWEFDAMRRQEADAALQTESAWQVPTNSDASGLVYIAATPRGLEQLRRSHWGASQ